VSSVRYTWVGWWLFVVSAALFGLSAVRSRDWLAVAGACAFLVANISFMVALRRDEKRRASDPER